MALEITCNSESNYLLLFILIKVKFSISKWLISIRSPLSNVYPSITPYTMLSIKFVTYLTMQSPNARDRDWLFFNKLPESSLQSILISSESREFVESISYIFQIIFKYLTSRVFIREIYSFLTSSNDSAVVILRGFISKLYWILVNLLTIRSHPYSWFCYLKMSNVMSVKSIGLFYSASFISPLVSWR